MPDSIKSFMSSATETMVLWKLVIFRGFLYSLAAFCLAFTTVFNNVNWTDLNGTQKAVAIIGILGVVTTALSAFVDQAMKSIAKGEIPLMIGQEVTSSKTTTQTNTTTITP